MYYDTYTEHVGHMFSKLYLICDAQNINCLVLYEYML